jgi:hypothetical protein
MLRLWYEDLLTTDPPIRTDTTTTAKPVYPHSDQSSSEGPPQDTEGHLG